jgi:hypothetical protein
MDIRIEDNIICCSRIRASANSVVGLFGFSTALSHLTNGSAFACVREWLHAVFSTTRTNSCQGIGRETRKKLPRVRQSSAAIDARLDAFSASSVSPTGDIQDRPRPWWDDNYHASISRDHLNVAISPLRCSDLRELRLYRVLQRSPLRSSNGSGRARSGGASWITHPNRNLLHTIQPVGLQ